MPANNALFVFADGNPVDVLRACPVLDKPATRALVERLFPDAVAEEVGDELLADALNPSADVVYVGCFPNLDLVCSWNLVPERPSRLDPAVLAATDRREVFLHAVHDDAGWCTYGLWRDGDRIRALSVCADPGVIEDEGEPLTFERPYWAGEHPADDARLPFDPLTLGDTALRSFVGFACTVEDRIDDVDPELIPVVGYRIRQAASTGLPAGRAA